ncbi:glycosyltransferase [bacterium]|nr:glycosyltransferase [bacterium]
MEKLAKKINLGYISDAGFYSTAFHSQVLSLLTGLKDKVENISLVVLEQSLFPFLRLKDPEIKRSWKRIKEQFKTVEVIVQKPRILRWLMQIESRSLKRIINDNLDKVNVLHCHGEAGSYLGLLARKEIGKDIPLISDLRGLVSQESLLCGKDGNLITSFLFNLRAHEFKKIEEYVVKESDLIFCVSRKFKEYLKEIYKVSPDRVAVVPSLVDSKSFFFNPEVRARKREELGIEKRIVFVYTGSTVKWQLPEVTVEVFKKIKRMIPEAFLLFLTNNVSCARKYFNGIDKEDYLLISVPNREVPAYLNAADVSILLREKNLVNRVASPIKFGEYLCCGLPVIMTPGIGDTEEIIEKHRIGRLLDLKGLQINKDDLLQLLNSVERERIAEIGKELFSVESYESRIISYWTQLLT